MYDLKKVIEANTVDGVVDYEKVMATLDDSYVNPIVAKKTDKEKLHNEAVASVVKDLGIDGESIDDLKLYVKKMGGSTDEIKEENLRILKEYNELKSTYETEVSTRAELEKKATLEKQMGLIKGLGVDGKQAEFLHWDFKKQVTEEKDFNAVVEEYATLNGVKTTTKYVKDDFSKPLGTIDLAEVFKESRKHRTK